MVTRKYRWGVVSVWLVVGIVGVSCAIVGMRWEDYVRAPLPDAAQYRDAAPPTNQIILDFEANRPGLENPPFADPQDERIGKSMRVIGVMVDGHAYAYSVKALSIPRRFGYGADKRELVRRHVVNQLLGDTAVSITYCDISACARVFKADHQTETLPLAVGGASNGKLVLSYNGKRYMHNDKKIPLTDCPFEVTFWGDWLSRHPDSRIYLGG
jgi:hypothetical protein